MVAVFFLLFFWGLPIFLSVYICEQRHRNQAKGLVVTLLFGWIGTLGLWLALRRRDPVTHVLI